MTKATGHLHESIICTIVHRNVVFESLTEFNVINCFHEDNHKDSHGHAFQLHLTGQAELKLDDNY